MVSQFIYEEDELICEVQKEDCISYPGKTCTLNPNILQWILEVAFVFVGSGIWTLIYVLW